MNDIQIIISGAAGDGTKATGYLIGKILNRCGYRIFIHEDYSSLIRGGHNFSVIRATRNNERCIREKTDFLLSLNEDSIEYHLGGLEEGTLIYNSDQIKDREGIGIPAETIAQEEGAIIMKSNALLGALCKVLGVDWDVIGDAFEGFPHSEKNLKVVRRTYDSQEKKHQIEKEKVASPMITGNEAVALGALEAGMQSYFAYPMTPSTSILHFLARLKEEYKIDVFQPENEIGVVNAALGCAFTGKRTMIGTSGGGFALMAEGISLAAMSETPLVVVDSQRAGPSSGVPTYNGQADLNFALSPGPGDFLSLLVAPGDAEEAFSFSNLAMNIAWKYQIPAVVLIDKDISESTFSFDENVIEGAEKWDEKKERNSKNYQRYQITEDGVSPLAYPGKKAVVKSGSYETDEYGVSTEDSEMIIKMQEKRMKKEDYIKEELSKKEAIKIYGEGDKILFCWGSTKGAAIAAGREAGYKVVQILVFKPFPVEKIREVVEGCKEVVVVESNSSGQAAEILKKYILVGRKILKYDGRPFSKEELIKKLKE